MKAVVFERYEVWSKLELLDKPHFVGESSTFLGALDLADGLAEAKNLWSVSVHLIQLLNPLHPSTPVHQSRIETYWVKSRDNGNWIKL